MFCTISLPRILLHSNCVCAQPSTSATHSHVKTVLRVRQAPIRSPAFLASPVPVRLASPAHSVKVSNLQHTLLACVRCAATLASEIFAVCIVRPCNRVSHIVSPQSLQSCSAATSCANLPCVYGSCFTAFGFAFCSCSAGYTGVNCQTGTRHVCRKHTHSTPSIMITTTVAYCNILAKRTTRLCVLTCSYGPLSQLALHLRAVPEQLCRRQLHVFLLSLLHWQSLPIK